MSLPWLMQPDRARGAVVEGADLVDQGDGVEPAGVAAGAGRDQDQAVDAGVQGAAGVAHRGDVVVDLAAVGVDGAHHRFGWMQRGDDERHAALGADGQVALPAGVAGVDDEVDAIGRDDGMRRRPARARQLVFDARDPRVQLFLRPGVERREGADDAGAALRRHQVRAGDQEHGSADDGQSGLRAQCGWLHGRVPVEVSWPGCWRS